MATKMDYTSRLNYPIKNKWVNSSGVFVLRLDLDKTMMTLISVWILLIVAARHCEREKTMNSLKSIGQIFI